MTTTIKATILPKTTRPSRDDNGRYEHVLQYREIILITANPETIKGIRKIIPTRTSKVIKELCAPIVKAWYSPVTVSSLPTAITFSKPCSNIGVPKPRPNGCSESLYKR